MEKSYIVTTLSNHTDGLVTLNWQELNATEFAFNKPFCLQFSDNQVFTSHEVVRLIPKRRIVAFGTWQGRHVVAKIFFEAKHAKKHMEQDIAGVRMLQKSKVPTPELLYEGVLKDKRVFVLLFDRIMDAKNLDEIWREKISIQDVLPILKTVALEIATQHVLGLLQHDLHLKNFLYTEKTIYTLDGAQIEVAPKMLTKKTSLNNFALFLSQLGIDAEGYKETLIKYYANARGWTLKPHDFQDIALMIRKWNDSRWAKFSKKIFRDSTDFARIHNWQALCVYNRQYESAEFLEFLSNPESAFLHPSKVSLKKGRSSTVIKVTLGQRHFVVKRYNIKDTWHRLRRCLRPSRAHASWRLAQKLCLFDIPTAKPVAFIEQRTLGFRGKSYFVMEYVPGKHANDYFVYQYNNEQKTAEMVRRISLLLKSVAKLEITHGDLKATNILVTPEEQPVLIDLDGAAEHLSLTGLRKAWTKEAKRFLDNFKNAPKVRQLFESELAKW